MEFGSYQVEIFLCLALLSGVSLIALTCGYLRSRNETFNVHTAELKLRYEEPAPSAGVPSSKDSFAVQETILSPVTAASGPEPERVLSRAAAPAGREEGQKRISQAEMIGIIRGAIESLTAEKARKAMQPRSVPRQPTPPQQRQAECAKSTLVQPQELPSGLHDGEVLGRLVEGGYRVSGLVVAIAVSSPLRAENSSEFPAAARSAIKSLLDPGEFAAVRGKNEFILIAPGACDAVGQRRLSRIPQYLWDVQLGSLGRCELQFTWGGLEVRDESLMDAVESAVERMEQTRHSRVFANPAPRESLPMRAAV